MIIPVRNSYLETQWFPVYALDGVSGAVGKSTAANRRQAPDRAESSSGFL